MKTFMVALLVCLCATLAFSQGIGRIDGTVTDPSGAAVPGAEVTVTSIATDQIFKATSDEKGQWSIIQLDGGSYRVNVTKPGFKVASAANVAVTAGEPTALVTKLEVGQATETVTVQSGAEIVQASTAEITNTLTDRQVTELPFATRNAVELMVTQPGTSTPTNPRSSTINGLPRGSINITIDGINTQDQELKSSDGFFSYIMPSVDSLEEVTLTTSAAGADSSGQGAAQIKFVTKSGTNQFHGGAFYQARNTFFDSNYYFNNETWANTTTHAGLTRDILHLRQYGAHIGGPIIKDKLFFFNNFEFFRNPASNAYARNIATASYVAGNYTYQTTTGSLNTVNLYNIAASGNSAVQPAGTRAFATTPDPIVAATYAQIAALAPPASALISNAGNGDYNSNTWNFEYSGVDARDFETARIDYNLTQKHHLSFTYNYDWYHSVPDFLNNVIPAYPGTGTILGTTGITGQFSNRFVGTLALRSALSARLTNELRMGLNGGTVAFFTGIAPGGFSPWKGYNYSVSYQTLLGGGFLPQRRNSPYKEVGDTVSWVKGAHQISAGATWESVKLWQQIEGSETVPSMSFGCVSPDPLCTSVSGSAAPFNIAANFPGASTFTGEATAYSQLTGRVSSISTRQVINPANHQYTYGIPPTDDDEEQWWGGFVQDVWRVSPSVTITAGLRYEKEGVWKNLDGLYTNVANASTWGVSGIGNLFQPGTLTGVVPTYSQLNSGSEYHEPGVWAPSVGIAWQLPSGEGILGAIFGHHPGASVLRAGYGIATTREGSGTFQSVYASNTGITQSASVSNAVDPTDFGAAGGVLFRDPVMPVHTGLPTSLQFPIAAIFTSSLNEFDPNLKLGYVQSWNIGFQRELSRNTVVEIRYTGNHGLHEWNQVNLNELNTVNNGFQTVFNQAANNLLIARTAGGCGQYGTCSNNFANAGLPGQVAIPFLQAALGTSCCNNSTFATDLAYGKVGTLASSLSTTLADNQNWVAGGFAANYFVVNPTVASGGTYDVLPWGSSYYDSGQVELRRRLSTGMQFQLNYSFSKSLADGATNSSSDSATFATLRDLRMSKTPDSFDIRQAIKANYIYELPFGPGRHFLSSPSSNVLKKAVEGWEIAGVARVQSGTPLAAWSGFSTVNGSGSGVVLHNITTAQLQGMVNIDKTQNPVSGIPQVYYLPPPVAPTGLTSANNTNFITNTWAALGVNNLTPAQVDPNAPYLGPASAGQWGGFVYTYANWQRHFDVSLIKVTHIKESVTIEFRAQCLNCANITNFLPGGGDTSTGFGTVTSAYRDISGTYDPGGRILEAVIRVNF